MSVVAKFFNFNENHTSFKQETIAGFTTFLTMSYIIFINPAILATTGMDKASVFSATCVVSMIGCLISGIIANNPIAIAPGMALNTFFAFIVVGAKGFSWQSALGMVFVSGLLFIILTLTKFRQKLIDTIPYDLKMAILLGISLFIAMIALKNNQLILPSETTLIKLGNLGSQGNLLFGLGFFLILLFDFYKVQGGILISIFIVSVIDICLGNQSFSGFINTPPSLSPTFLQLDLSNLLTPLALSQILAFLLIALFDATGTFIGLLNQGIFNHHSQEQIKKRISKGLLADSFTTAIAALMGTSTTGPFIESASGITAGGRTGFSAIIIAALFALSLFFYPLVESIPSYAINPALFYIALCMLKNITSLNSKDIISFAPAAVTMIMIPFSFSVAGGIGLGLILYCLLSIFARKFSNLSPMICFLSLLFLLYFALT